jgi:hypothetical protein
MRQVDTLVRHNAVASDHGRRPNRDTFYLCLHVVLTTLLLLSFWQPTSFCIQLSVILALVSP